MPVFRYQGLSAAGKSVNGTVEASNEAGAYRLLTGDGITPVALETGVAQEGPKPGRRRLSWGLGDLWGSGRVPAATRTLFMRELATFIGADIPLLEALDVLRKQEANPRFQAILNDIHDQVKGGESFSKALTAYPKVFSPLLFSMVRVGETGGMLGPVLEQMATWMEHEEEVRDEVRAAMAYPMMIVSLGFVTVIILLSFVLPRITTIFAGMEAELPLPTRLLMSTAGFMGRWWWTLPIVGVLAAVGVARGIKTPAGRNLYDRAALGLPIFGTLSMRSALSRFARANSAMLASGVPLLESLKVVRGLVDNTLIVAMIERTIEGVTRGQPLARSLAQSPYFPPGVIHLLGVGERTGKLAEMFDRVAKTSERQTRAQIKVLLNLLSPLLIIALAVVVAFIAISILLPIFRMNQLMR